MRELPPGPGTPGPFQILQWVFRPIPFMLRCAEVYGDIFTVRMLGRTPIVFLTDPAAIRQVFTGDPEYLQAGQANSRILRWLVGPNSLLVLDGALHLPHPQAP